LGEGYRRRVVKAHSYLITHPPQHKQKNFFFFLIIIKKSNQSEEIGKPTWQSVCGVSKSINKVPQLCTGPASQGWCPNATNWQPWQPKSFFLFYFHLIFSFLFNVYVIISLFFFIFLYLFHWLGLRKE